jgi:hypothetical protein
MRAARAADRNHVSPSPDDARWKWLLLTLCTLTSIVAVCESVSWFGLGAPPWLGYWDAIYVREAPYLTKITDVEPGGASYAAGLRNGDTVDLREQAFAGRVRWTDQPLGGRPTSLVVRRGSRTFTAVVVGSTVWEGHVLWKLPEYILLSLGNAAFLAFTWVVSLGAPRRHEARILALVFLCQPLASLDTVIVPNPVFRLLLYAAGAAAALVQSILLVRLASLFGTRYAWRRPLEWSAYVANTVVFLVVCAVVIGIGTLAIDPLPLILAAWFSKGAVPALIAAAAVAAVASTSPSQRPRAAWLLLPLPFALMVAQISNIAQGLTQNWFVFVGFQTFASVFLFLGALAITYALLKRRVLDFEFILSRTLTVAIVSAIVLASFVLLEWLLGTVLAGASHATGLIANGALALVLGLSLRYVHRHVDKFIDVTFFRKRYDDERALRDFAKEAPFITQVPALLDRAIETLERHTATRSAAILLGGDGRYSTVRSFGETSSMSIDENDGAIVALKAWHKSLDPHYYHSALPGALALPIFVSGKLNGVVVLGEREGGEAYAADEIEALSQFADGVGSAMGGLSTDRALPLEELKEFIRVSIAAAVASIATVASPDGAILPDSTAPLEG